MEVASLPPRQRVSEILSRFPRVDLFDSPTPVYEMARLRKKIGSSARILVKRDDTLAFAFGGNKVRKMEFVAAQALAERADVLLTTGGLQSNHARITAAVASRLGMDCHLVLNGERPVNPAGNMRLYEILGAQLHFVPNREARDPEMQRLTEEFRSAGRRPLQVPLGASIPIGALGFVAALVELLDQIPAPDFIVHSSSSGGTQAGLMAGCLLLGLKTEILGVSADESEDSLAGKVRHIISGISEACGPEHFPVPPEAAIHVDESFVGPGYGLPTPESTSAIKLTAQSEGFFLDHTYGGKAFAGLLHYLETGRIGPEQTVLFWHTGGQVGLFT